MEEGILRLPGEWIALSDVITCVEASAVCELVHTPSADQCLSLCTHCLSPCTNVYRHERTVDRGRGLVHRVQINVYQQGLSLSYLHLGSSAILGM